MAKGELLGSDTSDPSDDEGGAELPQQGDTDLKVNEDYARRFTYNKEREEVMRLEDKFGPGTSLKRKRPHQENDNSPDYDEDTSDSEDEDDAGELATEALDSEIHATLNAIRSKDPRVYDKEVTFYSKIDDEANSTSGGQEPSVKQNKPMFLRDYHRQNLLNGSKDDLQDDEEAPLTYNQEQDALKQSIVGEINAATAADSSAGDSSDGDNGGEQDHDDFLIAKTRRERGKREPASLDVEQAEKDPGTFLSNFMASRAWIPTERSQFQPFESDDEEEDRKAEEYEQAYNLRFEDPAKSNEKLTAHARDTATKYSVRREEKNARKRKREAENEQKEAAKNEKAQERARLRKLKIKEAENKLRKIKKAAGAGVDRHLSPEELAKFLDDDWDDSKWEEEMKKRFDDTYYAQDDVSSEEKGELGAKKSKRPRKPTWDDDIDIQDLVPDFDEGAPSFSDLKEGNGEVRRHPTGSDGHHRRSKKDRKKDIEDEKTEARRERRIVEHLVDEHLELDSAVAPSQERSAGFRYRQSSPVNFGLSARDILMAEDSQLNQFAGLKKLAPFRDPSKKKKDQKRLGKKARLRQWRKDTFGEEHEPTVPAAATSVVGGEDLDGASTNTGNPDIRTGPAKKKRRRSKKHGGGGETATADVPSSLD